MTDSPFISPQVHSMIPLWSQTRKEGKRTQKDKRIGRQKENKKIKQRGRHTRQSRDCRISTARSIPFFYSPLYRTYEHILRQHSLPLILSQPPCSLRA
mmetsp:Transcript_25278/g.49408  ORF Transcript_25278/g.49408 Transcript_25278/m.49408 type:complete len:98 (-) Transcript_25278:143-436(-)